jgi:glycerol-3-phosphate acyltransferase PlsY
VTVVIAPLVGYLIGSVPTALWLGKLWGVDLRRGGTGNPGANNARRLGGNTLALLVLIVEITKGLLAVVIGLMIAGQAGGLAAGLGAVTGNVFNVWLGFKGGKGLGISGGVILGLWPAAFPIVVVVIALASALTRSTGMGSLITIGVFLILALIWDRFGLESPWGLDEPRLRVILAVGLGLLVGPKHWKDARRRISSLSPGRSTSPESPGRS